MQPIGGMSSPALAAELLARLVHGDGGEDGAVGIVVAGDRRAPEGDDGVADELVDRPAMAEHDLAQHVEIAVEQAGELLRADRVAELGEAFEIGEERVDLPFLAASG